MEILVYIFVFFFGLIVGSFLNSIIYRLSTGESFLFNRSFCPHCKHQLSWQDLIPLLSFLILRGKCRYCHQKISWQYPLVELATGILFPLVFYHLSTLPGYVITLPGYVNLILLLVITCFLIIIFVYDLKHYIIPDKVIYPAIGIAFIYTLRDPVSLMRPGLVAAILASGFFLAIVLISRGKWMGAGDIKLAFSMGLFLSFPKILVALFLAFFIGAIVGVGLIIIGKKTLKSEVPFGPFLVVGTFLAMFFGENLINWYFSLFLG